MSAFISGGSATFEQSRKLAEYENRKASITFSITAGAEVDATATVRTAMDLAKDIVFKALGLAEGSISKPSPPREPFEEKVLAGTVAPAEKPKRAGKKLPAPAADPAALEATPLEKAIEAVSGVPERDPAGFDDPTTAAVIAVTDTEIREAVVRKNDALIKSVVASGKDGALGTKLIRELNASYGVKNVAEIPQAVRKEYLVKLEELK